MHVSIKENKPLTAYQDEIAADTAPKGDHGDLFTQISVDSTTSESEHVSGDTRTSRHSSSSGGPELLEDIDHEETLTDQSKTTTFTIPKVISTSIFTEKVINDLEVQIQSVLLEQRVTNKGRQPSKDKYDQYTKNIHSLIEHLRTHGLKDISTNKADREAALLMTNSSLEQINWQLLSILDLKNNIINAREHTKAFSKGLLVISNTITTLKLMRERVDAAYKIKDLEKKIQSLKNKLAEGTFITESGYGGSDPENINVIPNSPNHDTSLAMIQELETRLQKKRCNLEKANEKIEQITESLNSAAKKQEDLTTQANRYQQKLNDLQEELESVRYEVSKQKESHTTLTSELELKKLKEKQLEIQLKERINQSQELQARLDDQKQQNMALHEQLQVKTVELSDRDENIAKLRSQLNDQKQQLKELKARLGEANVNLRKQNEQIEQAQTLPQESSQNRSQTTKNADTQTDSTNTHHRSSYSLEYVRAEIIFQEWLTAVFNTLSELEQHVAQRLDQINAVIHNQQHLTDPKMKENFQKISHTYQSELQQEISRLKQNVEFIKNNHYLQAGWSIQQIKKEATNLRTYIETILPKMETAPTANDNGAVDLASLIAPLDKIKSANTVYEKTRPTLSSNQKNVRIFGIALAFGAAALLLAGGIALCVATAGLATPVVASLLAPVISALGSASMGVGAGAAVSGGVGLICRGVAAGITSPLKSKEQKRASRLGATGVNAACAFQAAQEEINNVNHSNTTVTTVTT